MSPCIYKIFLCVEVLIQSDFRRKKSGFGDFPGELVGRGRSTQALEGRAPSTPLVFFKHFNFTNDLETFF